MLGVQSGQLRPKWPRGSPRGLVDITMRCWVQEPELRPTFSDIIKELDRVEAEMRMELLSRMDTAKSSGSASASEAGSSCHSTSSPSPAAVAWARGGGGPAQTSRYSREAAS